MMDRIKVFKEFWGYCGDVVVRRLLEGDCFVYFDGVEFTLDPGFGVEVINIGWLRDIVEELYREGKDPEWIADIILESLDDLLEDNPLC